MITSSRPAWIIIVRTVSAIKTKQKTKNNKKKTNQNKNLGKVLLCYIADWKITV
jgi:hypothetical protein